jgi:hypothetical protein
LYRLYIEDFNPPIWAIDDGNPLNQQHFEAVIIEAIGFTYYDLAADNISKPKCWIRFPTAKLVIIGSTAILR